MRPAWKVGISARSSTYTTYKRCPDTSIRLKRLTVKLPSGCADATVVQPK
jgi:hypothetical protein